MTYLSPKDIATSLREKLMKRLFKYGEAQHIPGICMSDITEIVLDEYAQIRQNDLKSHIEKLEKEKEIVTAFLNSKGTSVDDKTIHYCGGQFRALTDYQKYLESLNQVNE